MDSTLSQIAACLKVTEPTLERWIRQGRIPVEHIDGECRFNSAVLKRWAKTRNMDFAPPPATRQPPVIPAAGLAQAMSRGGVHRGIGGRSIEAVLENAVARLTMLPPPVRDELHGRLVHRERLSSTGIGRGVAIPHPRSPLNSSADPPLIATCYPDAPVDFNAVDHLPVFVLFILISPSIDSHLRLLSRLAFCLRDDDFTTFLRGRPEIEALIKRIEGFERQATATGY